jgi:2OG-Fe(II) oxygenase superfamily/Coenzyme PQQ synthesis protein D (PqqD)
VIYEREHAILLPRFLAPRLLAVIREQIDRGRFRRVIHKGFGSDEFLPRHNATAALIFLLDDPRVFAEIRRLTGCGPLRSVSASIRRAIAGKGKSLSWHNDNAESRRAAITINLSPRPYRGGLLEIRRKRDGSIVKQIANVGPGDAVLFRVSVALEHRNTEVIGPNPKTAFSGWFRSASVFDRSVLAKTKGDCRRGSKRVPHGVTPSSQIVISNDAASKGLDQGALLLNLRSGVVFRLDAIGTEMFERARRRTTPRQIARAIAASYDAPVELVERDAKRLVVELAARGLIEIIS